MDLFLIVYLIIFVAPISLLLHELGHVIGAILIKSETIKLVIGSGKEVIQINGSSTLQISIHQWFFWGAFTESVQSSPVQPRKVVIVAVLGPAFSLLWAFLFYYVTSFIAHPLLQLFFFFNLWIGVINILPFKIGIKQSDGYTIIRTLLK